MQRLIQILSRPVVWMTAVVFVAFWQVAFCRYTMKWDMTDQIFIWHRYINECFHAHAIPLWAPYSRFGYPISSDPQSGLFYPVTWLFTWFLRYTLYSNNLEYIIHITLAAFGMRYLLRTLRVSPFASGVFGLVYAMSGPFISNATHLILIDSLCWLPFILASYIRVLREDRAIYMLLTALFFFLNLCGGYMGITIILVYLMFAILVYHIISIKPIGKEVLIRLLSRNIFLGLITVLLSCGYLYAVAKGLPYIDRTGSLSKELANSVPFGPSSLITLISPATLGNAKNHPDNITMQDMYFGVIPLCLAMIFPITQRRRSSYIIMAGCILFLLASMGYHTPIRGWIYDYIPLMKLFRHAGIFRFFACLGFVILAARGFDELFVPDHKKFRAAFGYFLIIGGLAISALVTVLIRPGGYSLPAAQFVIILFSLISLITDWPSGDLKKSIIGILILIDMVMAVQAGMPKTIISDRSVKEVQASVDRFPSGFPVPDNALLMSCNQWNDSTIAPPIWQNAGFIRKQVSFAGFNGYVVKNYLDVSEGPGSFQKLGNKRLIESNTGGLIRITRFGPNIFCFDVEGQSDQLITFGQLSFPGWSASVDHKAVTVSESPDHFVTCAVPAGHHEVEMSFSPRGIVCAFIYTVAVVLMALMAIGFLSRRAY